MTDRSIDSQKEPVLKIRGLGKTFPNGVRALDQIHLDVLPGEFLVVIGLSGSGKSTLLRCINRLVDPTEGSIEFRGRRVNDFNKSEVRNLRRQVAMIFQHFNLVPRRSVMTNVLAGRLSRTPLWRSLLGRFTAEDRATAMRYLELVGIADKWSVRADQLSGGQQQRVAIARALAQNPQVLLADEPVASLDPATSHKVMDYLAKANRELGITVICNLHFLSLVREYATRVVALREGRVVFQGKPQEIDAKWFKQIYGEEAREVYVR